MVELYYMKINPDVSGKQPGTGFLSVEKRKRLNSLVSNEDRHRLVWGDHLLRHLISLKAQCLPEDIIFHYHPTGKPFIREPENLFFNLSHSGEFVVATLSDHETGVDAEVMDPAVISDQLAGTFMSDIEFRRFSRLHEAEKIPFFYRVWTVKESFIKTTGEGLAADLKNITIERGDEGLYVTLDHHPLKEFYFQEYHIDPGYSIIACSHSSGDFSQPTEVFLSDTILRILR